MRIRNHAKEAFLLVSLMVSEAFTMPRPKHTFAAAHLSSSSSLLKAAEKEFENDGAFFFMQPFLSVFGFQEGRSSIYGPTVEVKESDYPNEEEQQARRAKAEEDMTNIPIEERDRRRFAGEAAYKVAIGYAFFSALFLDDGSFDGTLARFAVVLPLTFASGYIKSADRGL